MAFNADTYRANKCKREAAAYLAQARDIKARAAKGDAYDWELPRVKTFAILAVSSARMSRFYRACAEMGRRV